MNRCILMLILLAAMTVSAAAAVRTADVVVAVFDSPDPVRESQTLTYRLAVTNRGPHSASNTVVTDVLPTGVDFVSCSLSQGSYTRDGSTLSCTLGTVAFGGTAAVTIVTTPSLTGSLTNDASISSDAVDTNSANNRASCVTLVLPPNRPPELTLPGTSIILPVGSSTSFVVQVQDPDHDPAVSITNTVKPSGSSFVNSNFTWTATTAFLNTTNLVTFVANDRQSQTNSVVTNSMTIVVPFDYDADNMSDGWEWSNFATLTNGPTGDRDGDGQDNYTEYVAGTQATNAGSLFAAGGASASAGTKYVVSWPAVAGRTYTVYKGTNLLQSFQLLAAGLTTGSYTDSPASLNRVYYRVKAGIP